MNEPRKTGATNDQIIAAARRWKESTGLTWNSAPDEDNALWCVAVQQIAEHLIPLGYWLMEPEQEQL